MEAAGLNTSKNQLQSSLVFILIITILSILSTKFSLPFLYGIEFIFLNAIAWFAYKRKGLHTAFTVSLLGAACGILLFAQSPLLALSPLEVLAVHWLLRKNNRSVMLACLIYWLPVGLLLHGLVYEGLLHSESRYMVLILLIQLANGLFNALLGEIAADNLPSSFAGNKGFRFREWRIDRVSFQLCTILLTIPFVVFLFINGTFIYRDTLASTSEKLRTIQVQLNGDINRLSETELRDFKVHSILQRAALHKAFDNLTLDSNVKITLIDPSQQVISTSDPSVKDGQENYQWELGADIRKVSNTLNLWQPKSIPEYNSISRWSASEFVSVSELGRVPGYQLIIRQPIASFQQSVFNLYTVSLSIAFTLILVFAILALYATRKFASSLAELAEFSTGIPRKIRLRSSIEWKESKVYEVNRLKNNFRDMSIELVKMFQEVNESQEKLRELVHYDALTGLANRYSFSHYLPSLIQEAREKGVEAACLFIDLDRFKFINDTLGHEAGDAVLKAVGERLNRFNGDNMKAFRLAGDEFVIVLSAPLPDNLEQWSDSVQQELSGEDILFNQHVIQLEFSAGIAIYPEHGQDGESLLRSADQAMYQAKVSGRNRIKMLLRQQPGQIGGNAL